MRKSIKEANEMANDMGLCVTSYNPGDNLTYKVQVGTNKSYFQDNGIFRAKKLAQVYKFLYDYKPATC